MKTMAVFVLMMFLAVPALAGSKVYTDEDLGKYKGDYSGLGGRSFSDSDGFRGIHWGTDIAKIKDMRHIGTDPSYGGVEVYIKNGDDLEIGAAKLEKIEYRFWRDKFSSVMIYISGFVNFQALKDACFEKFGKASKPNRFMEQYIWNLKNADMLLDYNEISKEATLFISSHEASEQQKKYTKDKAIEGSKRGF